MEIKFLSIEGFRDLFEILTSETAELAFSAMSGGMGQKGVEALNNVRVSAHITNMSLVEAIHMRDFASTFEGTFPKVSYDVSALDGESQSDVYAIQALVKAIGNDPDIKIDSGYINHILPIVCQRVDATVTFSGYGLQNIIGLEGKRLFLNSNPNIGDKYVYDEGNIKTMLEKMLVQKFFDTLSRSLVQVDRETEYFLQKKYFSPAREKYGADKTKFAQLLSVTSPVGSFSLRNDSPYHIMSVAKDINGWLTSRYKEDPDRIRRPNDGSHKVAVEGIRLNFSIILNVYEALLLKYVHPEMILCSENLSLQVADHYIEIDPSLHEKYYSRLESPISKILARREELEDAFAHFNLIFGGQVTAMNISLPFEADNPASPRAVWTMSETAYRDIMPAQYDICLLPLRKEIQKAYTSIMNIIGNAQ